MAYSENRKTEKFEEIKKRVISGESLRNILKGKEMPSPTTFYTWLSEDEKKLEQYARITQIRADLIFEDMLNIADKTDKDVIVSSDGKEIINHNVINRDRLRIDTRKWILSKLHPKKYGDKLDLTTANEKLTNDITLTNEQVDKIINGLKPES